MEQSLDSTCAVSVEVKDCQGASASIGYVVAPEGFRAGYEEPADLMAYWDNLKAQLKALPMQVKTTPLTVPQQYQDKYTCEDVEINCLGPAPMRAYVAKPVGAKEKSLPIIILCRAAGVKGDWCRCSVNECVGNSALGNGALSLDLNAHGMLNGQSDDYYKMLEAAAGLDPRVSAVVLNVPAMQDLGGARKERLSGWPQPIENHQDLSSAQLDNTLPYFDGSQLIRHTKAEIFCEIGLIDTTCPPSAVFSSLNNAKGKKTVKCVPYRTHAWPSGDLRPHWEENYLHPREAFINDYLK